MITPECMDQSDIASKSLDYRHLLHAQMSPLFQSEIYAGDFTNPSDRVALNSLKTELVGAESKDV